MFIFNFIADVENNDKPHQNVLSKMALRLTNNQNKDLSLCLDGEKNKDREQNGGMTNNL